MPRDGSNIYHRPAGTDGVPNFPIESSKYNAYVADVEQDLNLPRPIVAGGTGANNATDALFNVKGEMATQVVTNWDSQVWVPGSFYAASTATGTAPVAGHNFAGVCYIGEALANPPTNLNVILEARDLDNATPPGALYVRQKKAGVWSAWSVGTVGTLTDAEKTAARQQIYAAPFDALAYNGMQINGGMDVSQERGTTATAASGSYIVDGWMLFTSGTGVVGSGQTAGSGFFPGYPNCIGFYVTTAQAVMGAGDYYIIQQRIEGWRVAKLAWGTANAQPLTIGFWSAHTRTGVYSITVRNGAGNRTYSTTYTQSASNVAQFNVIAVPGDTTGTWTTDNTVGLVIVFAVASGSSSIAGSANVWFAGFAVAAPGQINGIAALSDNFRITGVVILPGIEAPSAVRSPLIMRPYDQELVTCMRYWEKSYQPSVAPGTPAGSSYNFVLASNIANGSNLLYTIKFAAVKRVAPTVTLYAPSTGTINSVTVAGSARNAAIIDVTPSYICSIQNQSGVTFNVQENYQIHYTADARL